MQLTRRTLITSLPSLSLFSGCTATGISPKGFEALVQAPKGQRAPAAGYVILRGDQILAAEAIGKAQLAPATPRAFSVQAPFRAASISKLVTALTAFSLHQEGVVDLDDPIDVYWPAFPKAAQASAERAPTLRQFLAHTSGLGDPDQYWLRHPGRITDALAAELRPRIGRPGDFWYCNLGYGLVATALELSSGERFDQLAKDRVLDPLGLDAGFNWAGVSAGKRALGATLYRETHQGWEVQLDGPDSLTTSTPAILLAEGADLDTYIPGQNGTLFSPQGGLRANLLDLAKIAGALKQAPELAQQIWALNTARSNGQHDAEYYTQFGSGVHIYPADASFWPGQTLWGHHGEAYGLYAGAWYAPDLDVSFSYVVTGTPQAPPKPSLQHAGLNTFTEALVSQILATYASSPAAK